MIWDTLMPSRNNIVKGTYMYTTTTSYTTAAVHGGTTHELYKGHNRQRTLFNAQDPM